MLRVNTPMQFDLISDLHLDLWKENIKDWRGLGTSLTCVCAGDVSRDLNLTAGFLRHLCDSYEQVIFIDGNHEHFRKYDQIEHTTEKIYDLTKKLKNFTYLSDSSLVINKTAFIGSNGWWTFDFPELSGAANRIDVMEEYCAHDKRTMREAIQIWTQAQEQAEFLSDVVEKLQTNDDIGEIVIVTHTVPRQELAYRPSNGDMFAWGKIGNSSMINVLDNDVEGKISTWCFGHNHPYEVDQMLDGVRYVCHARGRPDDCPSGSYYPKLIDTHNDLMTNR